MLGSFTVAIEERTSFWKTMKKWVSKAKSEWNKKRKPNGAPNACKESEIDINRRSVDGLAHFAVWHSSVEFVYDRVPFSLSLSPSLSLIHSYTLSLILSLSLSVTFHSHISCVYVYQSSTILVLLVCTYQYQYKYVHINLIVILQIIDIHLLFVSSRAPRMNPINRSN